jgi:transposase
MHCKQEENALPGKRHKLAASGTLNPTPEKVHDRLFQSHTFFDPHDALQVKYEMLRRVEKDGRSVTRAANDFGFSRRHFYALQHQFAEHGFQAFVPKKRGPKGAHKLTDAVMDFIDQARQDNPDSQASELSHRVHEHFGLRVHPRSIEKALARKKKDPIA